MKSRSQGFARSVGCALALIAMLAPGTIVCAQRAAQPALLAAIDPSAGEASAQTAGGATHSQGQSHDQDSNQAQDQSNDNGLVIEPAELPQTYLQGPYGVQFAGRGNYVPTLHWKVAKGKLPPGLTLSDRGSLQGEARLTGEFNFTVAVTDGNQPPQAVQRDFTIKVVDALTLAWKVPAHVNGNRIDGSVEVSNATVDDIDLTLDAKAVAEDGRATEIGYQHFPLKKGTTGMVLPLGDTLPPGGYIVNVTVIGEIAQRNAIYRQMLQTPGALHVTVGP